MRRCSGATSRWGRTAGPGVDAGAALVAGVPARAGAVEEVGGLRARAWGGREVRHGVAAEHRLELLTELDLKDAAGEVHADAGSRGSELPWGSLGRRFGSNSPPLNQELHYLDL